MDHLNENQPIENGTPEVNKAEQKFRHPRRNHNNDLWIHVDAQNSDSNKFLGALTGISTLAAISLVAVSLINYNQTALLTKQNEELLAKYEQAMTELAATNTEAIESLKEGLDDVADSVDRLTIVMAQDNTNIETAAPEATEPVEEAAFFGVLVMNDGSAITPLGLRIAGIYNHSPAAQAGIQAGDIIMSIDDTPIDTFETMSGIIASKKPGDTMTVRFARTEDNTVYFNTVSVILDKASNYDTNLSEADPQP